jgi:hypothetical protein
MWETINDFKDDKDLLRLAHHFSPTQPQRVWHNKFSLPLKAFAGGMVKPAVFKNETTTRKIKRFRKYLRLFAA